MCIGGMFSKPKPIIMPAPAPILQREEPEAKVRFGSTAAASAADKTVASKKRGTRGFRVDLTGGVGAGAGLNVPTSAKK